MYTRRRIAGNWLPTGMRCHVNVAEGLKVIRERLVDNGAEPATIATVDLFLSRATLPAAQSASATSLLQLVRLLMRTPAANNNNRVYNDLVRLEEELETSSAAAQARRAEEDNRPVPKDKKYYKALKEKEKDKGTA